MAWRRWSRSPEMTTGSGRVERDPADRGIGGHGVAAGARRREDGEVDGHPLRRPRLVEPGQQEQVADEDLHPRPISSSMRRRMTASSTSVLTGPDAEELGEALDGGQRRPQLVRRVGEELAQPLLGRLALAEGVLDLAEHGVEGQPELADLGAGRRRGPPAATGRRR